MTVEKVVAGSRLRIRARDWNAVADAANAHAAGRLGQAGGGAGSASNAIIVPVKNTSGADRARFEVLGIGGAVFDPFAELPAFQADVVVEGDTPTEPDHVGRFVILLEPIADGAIGRAIVAGPVAVKINVESADEADFADVCDGQAGYLTTGPTGSAYVLWRQKQGQSPGTGEQWAYVLLGTPNFPSISGDEYAVLQLQNAGGGFLKPVWDYVRMHP